MDKEYTHVITLIANSSADLLDDGLVQHIWQTLHDAHARIWSGSKVLQSEPCWLSDDRACDIYFYSDANTRPTAAGKISYLLAGTFGLRTGLSPTTAMGITCHEIADAPIDCIIQPAANRAKKLLISDMDSTMITVECIDELADFVGKKTEVAAITERAMNGELDFEAALIERVALLKGLPESVLQTCYDERVKMMPGAKELVSAMRANGAHCVLVSGGFTFFTSRVAGELGFHEHYANELIIENGHLTGEVKKPILGKEAKLQTLRDMCRKLNISTDDVLAVGDGANDLPMLLAAGLGVAYHAKPSVQAEAKHRINHNDLRALIWAQGLKEA